MNLNLYPKPDDVPAGVWRRTLVALHARAYRHAEGRSHTRLTELLPSRTVGYTLRHLYKHPFCCTSEQKYIDEALHRYEFLLDKSEMRERQRLSRLQERCMADMPVEWSPEAHRSESLLQQNPTFQEVAANALSGADLIAGLCKLGVSEYIAYLWLYLRWYEYSYEETAFHLKNRFGEDRKPEALRQMANRYFRKNPTLMRQFYILLTGDPPSPEMWNRIKEPMKISSKTAHAKKRPQRPERCGRFAYLPVVLGWIPALFQVFTQPFQNENAFGIKTLSTITVLRYKQSLSDRFKKFFELTGYICHTKFMKNLRYGWHG